MGFVDSYVKTTVDVQRRYGLIAVFAGVVTFAAFWIWFDYELKHSGDKPGPASDAVSLPRDQCLAILRGLPPDVKADVVGAIAQFPDDAARVASGMLRAHNYPSAADCVLYHPDLLSMWKP